MTEPEIRKMADRHGLIVEKSITTGNEGRHFATFSISGNSPDDNKRVEEFWRELAKTDDPRRFGRGQFNTYQYRNLARPGVHWIEMQSVWCEVTP